MPIEHEHITKQHGGTVFTEEITHYAAVPNKKIIQLHFHCICWCKFAWKWISTAVENNRALNDKKEEGGGEMEVNHWLIKCDRRWEIPVAVKDVEKSVTHALAEGARG